jgi:hypothetical protein
VVPPQALEHLQDVEKAIAALAVSLRARRPERGPAQDERQAIDLVLAHLQRHGPQLFGHAIALPDGGVRLVDRTNNALEGFHHQLKHGERRRSGRKLLTQDFEHLPAAAVLAANLHRQDYVRALCGTIDQLPAAFASLDATRGPQPRPSAPPAEPAADFADIESASLPTADRRLVRTPAMARRIHAAASSRPPRRPVATAL